jgi:hypothetical protein
VQFVKSGSTDSEAGNEVVCFEVHCGDLLLMMYALDSKKVTNWLALL